MIRVAILTVSDSAVMGIRADASGPALAECARQSGWAIAQTRIVRDEIDEIGPAIVEWADSGAVDVILCTGGTGIAPRDVTPEAVAAIASKQVPGLGEVMRAEGRTSTKFAALSRSGAYTRGTALILTLPGSPRGAVQSLQAVADLIPHAVNLLHGRTAHEKETRDKREASQGGEVCEGS